jgi:hypothetical protein
VARGTRPFDFIHWGERDFVPIAFDLMREKSTFLGARLRAGPAEAYLQAAGSQRHFSLVKVSLWAQR